MIARAAYGYLDCSFYFIYGMVSKVFMFIFRQNNQFLNLIGQGQIREQ